jgi:hypothetical protein
MKLHPSFCLLEFRIHIFAEGVLTQCGVGDPY